MVHSVDTAVCSIINCSKSYQRQHYSTNLRSADSILTLQIHLLDCRLHTSSVESDHSLSSECLLPISSLCYCAPPDMTHQIGGISRILVQWVFCTLLMARRGRGPWWILLWVVMCISICCSCPSFWCNRCCWSGCWRSRHILALLTWFSLWQCTLPCSYLTIWCLFWCSLLDQCWWCPWCWWLSGHWLGRCRWTVTSLCRCTRHQCPCRDIGWSLWTYRIGMVVWQISVGCIGYWQQYWR